MVGSIGLIPAYGRDYKSKAEVSADWLADKDFQIADVSCRWNGSYINRPQAIEHGFNQVQVRYAKKTKVVFVEVESGKAK